MSKVGVEVEELQLAAEHLVVGALVTWQDKLGVIVSLQVDGDGAMAEVRFDDGDHKFFKTESGAIERVVLTAGMQVMGGDGNIGVVLGAASEGDYPSWSVAFPGTQK